MDPRRALSVLAWLNLVLHLLGLALAVIGMRPGTAVQPLPERIAYLGGRPLGWTLGWAVWAACAVVLVGFLGALLACSRTTAEGALRGLGVARAAAGAAVDLSCDTLWVSVVPSLAASGQAALFLVVERALVAVGTAVANGLYSLAVLLVAHTLHEGRLLGWATFGFGMLMVGAGLGGDPRHLEWVTGPTIAAFLAWMLVVARAEARRA